MTATARFSIMFFALSILALGSQVEPNLISVDKDSVRIFHIQQTSSSIHLARRYLNCSLGFTAAAMLMRLVSAGIEASGRYHVNPGFSRALPGGLDLLAVVAVIKAWYHSRQANDHLRKVTTTN